MQASVPSALHFKMDRSSNTGAAEVPDVSPRLDVQEREAVNPLSPQEEDGSCSKPETRRQPASDLDVSSSPLATPDPKRQRRTSDPPALFLAVQSDSQHETALLKSVPKKMRKYFAQRHRLFHRYDEGIQLDEEAWYSVTPEKIAAHIARRFAHLKVVVDLYSCVGGNSIQFAKAGLRVIAVEIDHEKISMAKNNAAVYGVQDSIEFREGDAMQTLSALGDQFDDEWGIFMSPPWGGPSYLHQDSFDTSVFAEAVGIAREMSSSVGILMPRNATTENVVENFGGCEIEENYLSGKMKTKTLYFGDMAGRGANLVDNKRE